MNHLAQLRLMRTTAIGDNAAALDHAIAVLEACGALDRLSLTSKDWISLDGPSADEPTWKVESVEATTLDGALVAYMREVVR